MFTVLTLIGVIVFGALAVVALFYAFPRLQFMSGGALVNLGYRLQDHLAKFDLVHPKATPQQILSEFLAQNKMASKVRKIFPRTMRHPVVAVVHCMDGRLDTLELTGDTRHYYYVIRTAGSALGPKEIDMLTLAVANGVKVIIFTTHTDCAAEKIAADLVKRRDYPALAEAVDRREERVEELLRRPIIAERMRRGELIVEWLNVDTLHVGITPYAPSRPALQAVVGGGR